MRALGAPGVSDTRGRRDTAGGVSVRPGLSREAVAWANRHTCPPTKLRRLVIPQWPTHASQVIAEAEGMHLFALGEVDAEPNLARIWRHDQQCDDREFSHEAPERLATTAAPRVHRAR